MDVNENQSNDESENQPRIYVEGAEENESPEASLVSTETVESENLPEEELEALGIRLVPLPPPSREQLLIQGNPGSCHREDDQIGSDQEGNRENSILKNKEDDNVVENKLDECNSMKSSVEENTEGNDSENDEKTHVEGDTEIQEPKKVGKDIANMMVKIRLSDEELHHLRQVERALEEEKAQEESEGIFICELCNAVIQGEHDCTEVKVKIDECTKEASKINLNRTGSSSTSTSLSDESINKSRDRELTLHQEGEQDACVPEENLEGRIYDGYIPIIPCSVEITDSDEEAYFKELAARRAKAIEDLQENDSTSSSQSNKEDSYKSNSESHTEAPHDSSSTENTSITYPRIVPRPSNQAMNPWTLFCRSNRAKSFDKIVTFETVQDFHDCVKPVAQLSIGSKYLILRKGLNILDCIETGGRWKFPVRISDSEKSIDYYWEMVINHVVNELFEDEGTSYSQEICGVSITRKSSLYKIQIYTKNETHFEANLFIGRLMGSRVFVNLNRIEYYVNNEPLSEPLYVVC